MLPPSQGPLFDLPLRSGKTPRQAEARPGLLDCLGADVAAHGGSRIDGDDDAALEPRLESLLYRQVHKRSPHKEPPSPYLGLEAFLGLFGSILGDGPNVVERGSFSILPETRRYKAQILHPKPLPGQGVRPQGALKYPFLGPTTWSHEASYWSYNIKS